MYCYFDNTDKTIREQIIERCCLHRLRRKLLERRDGALQQLREISQALESYERQAKAMEKMKIEF